MDGPHAESRSLTRGRLTATWRFPVSPLIVIERDGKQVACVDYVEQSASVRWGLSWQGAAGALPLMPLATQVPEEVDGDAALRDSALDVALKAFEQHLASHAARLP